MSWMIKVNEENALLLITSHFGGNEKSITKFTSQLKALRLNEAQGVAYLYLTSKEYNEQYNCSLEKFAHLIHGGASGYYDIVEYLIAEMDIEEHLRPNSKEMRKLYNLAEGDIQAYLNYIRLGQKFLKTCHYSGKILKSEKIQYAELIEKIYKLRKHHGPNETVKLLQSYYLSGTTEFDKKEDEEDPFSEDPVDENTSDTYEDEDLYVV